MLGLNCGHNVAHGPTPCPFELGQQRIGDAAATDGVGFVIEIFVEDRNHLMIFDRVSAPSDQLHGVSPGSAIKWGGRGNAPINHKRVAVPAFDVATPDVEFVGSIVDAPEENPCGVVGKALHPMSKRPLNDGRIHLGRCGCGFARSQGAAPHPSQTLTGFVVRGLLAVPCVLDRHDQVSEYRSVSRTASVDA